MRKEFKKHSSLYSKESTKKIEAFDKKKSNLVLIKNKK